MSKASALFKNLDWLKNPLIIATFLTLIYVGFTLALGLYSTKLIPGNTGALAHYHLETTNPLNHLAEWDSYYYLSIAQHGYFQPVYAAFFPLYSILIWPISQIIGSVLDAALAVSWLCLIGAVYFYRGSLKLSFSRLTDTELNSYSLLFLLFPTAVFLVAAYSESLFALLALGAIYFAFKNRFSLAFLLAGLASITRINGLFVWFLIVVLAWENRQSLRKLATNSLLGLAPFGLWLIYLAHKFNNPLQFLGSEKLWGHFNGSYVSSLSHSLNMLNLLGTIAILVTVYFWARRRRWGFAVYSLLYLLVPFVSGSFDGFNRYILMVFPLQWMLASIVIKRPWLFAPLIGAMAAWWSYFVIQFFGGYTGG